MLTQQEFVDLDIGDQVALRPILRGLGPDGALLTVREKKLSESQLDGEIVFDASYYGVHIGVWTAAMGNGSQIVWEIDDRGQ